jgi:hypothetical protein
MNVYFAGIAGNVKRMEYLYEFGGKRLMLTYADERFYGAKQMERFSKFDILLDSGAFSIWKRGVDLKIDDYLTFIDKHKIKKYICLDKIGDPITTKNNQEQMESSGFEPIPVFHYGSDFVFLEEMCQKYDYICLGGTVGQKRNARDSFFKQVFDRFPTKKFHGLGMTDLNLVNKYNWFSIDSTTWLICEKVGKIFSDEGKRIDIPEGMSQYEKYKNTITYFSKLDN